MCKQELADPPAHDVIDASQRTWRYVSCGACGLIWADPMPSADDLYRYYDETYYGAGEAKFPHLIEKWIEQHRADRAKWVASLGRGGNRRVLDVGCGSGAFLRAISAYNCEIHGVELAGRAAERAALVPGIKLHVGSLASFSADERLFGLVTMWHVLEHMPDPYDALTRCHALLEAGGALVFDVPNGDSWQAAWFGPRWFHRDPPRHLFQFTAKSLSLALEKVGFRIEQCVSMQQEMGLFGCLQSMCNGFIQPRDYFYDLIRTRGRMKGNAGKKVVTVLLAGVFIIPAIVATLLESLFDKRAVLRVVARKV